MSTTNMVGGRAAGGFFTMKLSELAAFAREKGLYSKTGEVTVVPGTLVSGILGLETGKAVEERIDQLVALVKRGPTKDWRATQTQKVDSRVAAEAVLEAAAIAQESKDPAELQYLTGMFIHYKEVMRALARNPAISEQTQLILASDVDLTKDRGVQLGLAHNPALTAPIMAKIMAQSDDHFVLTGIAMNAVHQAARTQGHCAFGEICKALAGSFDPVLREAALAGVKDGEYLRSVAMNKSALLAPKEVYAVAANKHTPDDALEHIAGTRLAPLQLAIGIQAAERARSTLANNRYERGLSSENTAPAY